VSLHPATMPASTPMSSIAWRSRPPTLTDAWIVTVISALAIHRDGSAEDVSQGIRQFGKTKLMADLVEASRTNSLARQREFTGSLVPQKQTRPGGRNRQERWSAHHAGERAGVVAVAMRQWCDAVQRSVEFGVPQAPVVQLAESLAADPGHPQAT